MIYIIIGLNLKLNKASQNNLNTFPKIPPNSKPTQNTEAYKNEAHYTIPLRGCLGIHTYVYMLHYLHRVFMRYFNCIFQFLNVEYNSFKPNLTNGFVNDMDSY